MNDLYVDAEARGQGVGRALIEASAAVARERGAHHLEWSTAPDNATAQRLYDSTGAEQLDLARVRARALSVGSGNGRSRRPGGAAALRRLHPRGRRAARPRAGRRRGGDRRRAPGEPGPARGVLLLARVDGDPAGLGGVRHLDTPVAEVKSMYVAPAYRGTRPRPQDHRRARARSPSSTAAARPVSTPPLPHRRGRRSTARPATGRSPTTTATRKPTSGSNVGCSAAAYIA